jgi:hypothetical protein
VVRVHDLSVRRILSRPLLAAAILAVPVAVTIGSTVREDIDAMRDHSRLSRVEAEVAPPFPFPGYRNVPLLLGVRRLVPPRASIAFLSRDPPDVYLQTGWVRWAAFVLAPRLIVERRDAPWVVLVHQTPDEAGIFSRRVWRFGNDRLVRR